MMFEYLWNVILSGSNSKEPSPSAPDLISETLLEELHSSLKEIEALQQEKEARRKREAGRPDYSWLVNESVKHYKIPQTLRTEIEDLCMQFDADVAPLVIKDFRRIISDETPVEKIPDLFKCVLKRQLLIKNLKTETDHQRDSRKMNKSGKNMNGIFKRRLEVPGLRERDIEAWGTSKEGAAEARVHSAPASSWRFFRQAKVQPTEKPNNQIDSIKFDDKTETRRSNSVPTITTLV